MAAVVVSGLSWSPQAAAAEQAPSGGLSALLPDDLMADLSGSEARTVIGALASSGATASLPVAVLSSDGGSLVVTRLAAQPARAAQLAAVLKQQPSVEAADVDGTVHALGTVDPYAGSQWPLARLESSSVWATVAAFSDPAAALPVVAVIDTGLQADHPDLQGLSVAGYDFVTATPTAAGASTDPHGHGTHVSGIIGATVSNGVGVAGLLPAARIMPVRVLDAAGGGNSSAVADGMVWAVDHGAKVLSLSLGGGSSTLMQAAADYAEAHGVLVVAAAGNDGGGGGSNAESFPCAYVTVLCVGATTQSDAIASFSTHGPQVDIAAPGESVLSTYHGSGYVYMSGTSMATPYVAASAAFAWSGHPGYTSAQLRDRLVATADDLGTPGRDDFFGAGLVDPVAAFSSSATPPPRTPTSFVATLSDTTASFVWGSAVRASAFTVRASVDGGAVTDVVRTSATSASLAVQPGSSYVFTLVATNEGGSSPPLTQQLAVRPAAPQLTGAATLAWAPVAGATSYSVWHDGGTTPVTTTAATSYAPSVAPGTSQAFRVTAGGPTGVSDPSNAVTVVVLVAPGVPAASGVPVVAVPEPEARSAFPAPVLAAPGLELSGPDRLVFGSSAAISARATNGSRVSLSVSGPCSLTGTLLRARSGVGSCIVTARTAASASRARATATVVVATARARDTVSAVRAGRLTRTSDQSLALRARSGLRVTVAVSGPCTLRKNVLHARAATGTCRLRVKTSGSRNWQAVELVQVFAIGAQTVTTSHR